MKKTRIIVFGTFDILHKGHINFFKQARRLVKDPYLIVSVARDINVKKIKGHKTINNEKYRLRQISKQKQVNRAVLGSKTNYIKHILEEEPEIIALGYDQKAYTKNLKAILSKKGLKVKIRRLKSYFPKKYKSSLFKQKVL